MGGVCYLICFEIGIGYGAVRGGGIPVGRGYMLYAHLPFGPRHLIGPLWPARRSVPRGIAHEHANDPPCGHKPQDRTQRTGNTCFQYGHAEAAKDSSTARLHRITVPSRPPVLKWQCHSARHMTGLLLPSPPSHMSSFDDLGLRPELLRALVDIGFTTPTPVQEKAIPLMLKSDKDVVALAQTGTGKTAAFGLPLLEFLDPPGPRRPRPNFLLLPVSCACRSARILSGMRSI